MKLRTTTLVGRRVTLVEPTESDFEFFHSWISDPMIMEFLDWKTESLEESRARFDEIAEDRNSADRKRYFFIVKDENGERVGECGFSIVAERRDQAELGYFIKPSFWGNGYAAEAAQLVIEFAFNELGLKKMIAECAAENLGSERVMKKLGMVYECRFEKEYPKQKVIREKLRYFLEA